MSVSNIPKRKHGTDTLFSELLWLLLVPWVHFRVLVLTLNGLGVELRFQSWALLLIPLPIKEKVGESGQGVVCHNPFVLKFIFYSVWPRLNLMEIGFPGLVVCEPLLKAAAVASFQGRLHVPACFPNQDSTPTHLPVPTLNSLLPSTHPSWATVHSLAPISSPSFPICQNKDSSPTPLPS